MSWRFALLRIRQGFRTEGFLLLCFAVAAVAVLVALVVGTLLGTVWVFGGLRTDGSTIDWSAVSALAAVAVAIATTGAAAALFFAAFEFDRRSREYQTQLESDRIRHRPYVRADVAFLELHEANFQVPDTQHLYTPVELGISDELDSLLGFLRKPDDATTYSLVLWLRNLQQEPLGLADRVQARLSIGWRAERNLEFDEEEIELTVAYLAPGQTTAIQLCAVSPDLQIVVEVVAVEYEDIFGGRSRDSHGAMVLAYDREGGARNERKVQHEWRRTR